MQDFTVRHYKREDRVEVRRIACETAFMGSRAEKFFDDREIFADFLTLYFTDYEPESCFVAVVDSRVVGYLIGAKNSASIEKVFLFRILPRLIIKAVRRATILNKRNLSFLVNLFISFLKGELKAPDLSRDYPATLHLNVFEGFRDKGIGSRLIALYLDYLTKEGVRGVYLSTLSKRAGLFFEKQGFKLLYESQRTYFKNILEEEVFCKIYAMKLNK